jgi:CRP-like cAMP-binding protein
MLREYEMREKALYDYKSSISAALKRGEQEGIKKGSIITLQQIGYSAEKIASTLGTTIKEVNKVLEEQGFNEK